MTDVQEISTYVQKYTKEGFTDEEIRAGLVRSKVPSSLIDEGFAFSQKKYRSLLRVFLFLGVGLFLFLLILLVFLWQDSFSSLECGEKKDCPQGSFCSQGECVEQIGLLNCQIDVDCDVGYSCYTCIEDVDVSSE